MPAVTRAVTVTPNEPVRARQLASLCRAASDRILLGIGDVAWRFAWYIFAAWRQVRLPSGYLWPAQGEFWKLFGLVEPDSGRQVTWPDSGPGEPGGANVANIVMQYVFGVAPDLASEDLRLDVPLWRGFDPPATIGDCWVLGGWQRGVTTQDGLAQNAPALTAAQSFFQVVTPDWSPHGKNYGGFFPTPAILDADCGNGSTSDPGYLVPSREWKFTSLQADPDISALHFDSTALDGNGMTVGSYAGTCPPGSADVGVGHVWAVMKLPFAYYVAVTTDGVSAYVWDRLDRKQWMAGPFTGAPLLDFEDGDHLQRFLWAFGVDFRGTDDQRASDDFDIDAIAFAFEEFHRRQYLLAPAFGVQIGQNIKAVYPTAKLRGGARRRLSAGSRFSWSHGGSTIHSGFVAAGFFVDAHSLAETATVVVSDDGVALCSITVTPEACQAMAWPSTVGRGKITVALAERTTFTDDDGYIEVQMAELQEMLPEQWDLAFMLRLSATRGGSQYSAGVDGRGKDISYSRDFWTNYRTKGCIYNTDAAGVRTQGDWVNDNPVYDAARRLSVKHLRIVPRQQFVSYEVTAEDKTVLRYKRYPDRYPWVDLFAGIAPSPVALESGALVEGETYEVRGTGDARVRYNGTGYTSGQTFVAGTVKDFSARGDAAVFVHDGIREAALKNGWNNRWCSFIQGKCYHPNAAGNIWKADAYSDYFTFSERCLFMSGDVPDDVFKQHVTTNHSVDIDPVTGVKSIGPMLPSVYLVAPEAPTGYRFASDSNRSSMPTDFQASCQIYEPPDELESCTVEFSGDVEIVVLTYKARWRCHPDADGVAWPAEGYTWNSDDAVPAQATALTDEDYRTPDNAMRQYHLHTLNPHYQCGGPSAVNHKTGDRGASAGAVTGDPFGSCYADLFLVHLPAEPYLDGNQAMDKFDTRVTIDTMLHLELLLKAAAPGFVDEATTVEMSGCEVHAGGPDNTPCTADDEDLEAVPVTGDEYSGCCYDFTGLWDYTWETLNYQAHGGVSCGAFSLLVRPDEPSGHGPLPNCTMWADVFNRLANGWNLLTKARLPFAFNLDTVNTVYSSQRDLDVSEMPDCNVTGCTNYMGSPVSGHVFYNGQPPPATELSGLPPIELFGVAFVYGITGSVISGCGVAANTYSYGTVRDVGTWKFTPVDPDWLDAVPDAWADLITDSHVSTMFCDMNVMRRYLYKDGTVDCGPEGDFGTCAYEEDLVVDTTCHFMAGSGTIDFGPLPPPSVTAGMYDAGATCGWVGGARWRYLWPAGDGVAEKYYVEIPLADLPASVK